MGSVNTIAVLDGHHLTSRHGDGVNAYLYRRDDASGELVLDSRLETLAPGGNRVIAAIEVRVLEGTGLEDAVGQTEAHLGESPVPPTGVEVEVKGTREQDALLQILFAFRSLVGGRGERAAPLVFDRNIDGDLVRYVLAEESTARLRAALPHAHATPVTIGTDVRAAFEMAHGPFEAQLGLTALAGVDWQTLARIGGFEVRQGGQVVYRWPHF